MLDVLQRHKLFANLKKCQFHKDKICFLGYIMLAQGVKIEDKWIKTMKNWPKPTSARDIQVFIGFANFYQRFIQSFSKIAVSLISMLKTTWSFEELAPKAFRASNNEVVGNDDSRADETVIDLSKNKKSRKSTHMPNIEATKEPKLLTPDTKKAFNYLRLVFIKAPIFQYFNLESHIWIQINASSYAISRVLSQLNLDFDAPSNDLNSKSDFGQ